MNTSGTVTGRYSKSEPLQELPERRKTGQPTALDVDYSALELRVAATLPEDSRKELLEALAAPKPRCPRCGCDTRLYGCFCYADAPTHPPQEQP